MVKHSSISKIIYYVLSLSLVPIVLLWQVATGLVGNTQYKIDQRSKLAPIGRDTFESLPINVHDGLNRSVGDKSEYALRHISESLKIEADRKWARLLLNRIKGVSSVTTSIFLIGIVAWFVASVNFR